MHDAPTMRKEVPWKAVRIRKTKNEARLGLSAVPMEQARNRTDVMMQICMVEFAVSVCVTSIRPLKNGTWLPRPQRVGVDHSQMRFIR